MSLRAFCRSRLQYEKKTTFLISRKQDRKHEYHRKVMYKSHAHKLSHFRDVVIGWLSHALLWSVSFACEFRFYTNSTISAEHKSVYGQIYKLRIFEFLFYLVDIYVLEREGLMRNAISLLIVVKINQIICISRRQSNRNYSDISVKANIYKWSPHDLHFPWPSR